MAQDRPTEGETPHDRIPPEVHAGAERPAMDEPSAEADPEVMALPDEGIEAGPELAPVPESEPSDEPDPAARAREADHPPAAPAPVAPAPERRRGGFLPLLLGGLIAGAIGFAVATYTDTLDAADPLPDPTDTARDERIDGLERDLVTLTESLTAAQAERPVDTGGSEALAALQEQLDAQAARIDELAARIEEGLVAAPVMPDGEPAPDLDSYRAELDAIRSEMQGEIDALRSLADEQLAEARQAAETIEADAEAATRAAAGRAALARLQAALETGAPMTDPLRDIEDALGERPDAALLAVETGAPTLAELQAAFPDLARRALTEARREGVSGENDSPLGSFFRNQFSVRSIAPRDGEDVDAVLSRAEAAVAEGRLNDALAEVQTLPDPARAPLDDWIADARTRVAAQSAADALATTLNEN